MTIDGIYELLASVATLGSLICIVAKCIIFYQRDAKWWSALIPFYNKYKFGKWVGKKVLGVIVALLEFAWYCIIYAITYYQNFLISNYYAGMYDSTKMILNIPAEAQTLVMVLRIALIVVAAAYLFSWSYMMYKFSSMHEKPSWWIFGWAIIPAIPFAYIVLGNQIAMNGKKYVYVKKEVKSFADEAKKKK
jgi:hypothetical protein